MWSVLEDRSVVPAVFRPAISAFSSSYERGNGLVCTHSCKGVKECSSEGVNGRTSFPNPAVVVVVVAAEIFSSVVLSFSPHDVATEREREPNKQTCYTIQWNLRMMAHLGPDISSLIFMERLSHHLLGL